jgi:[acyl-carrier-protein] S-malonyltransferase
MAALAFLFPGQASQAVGMGRDLCERYPVARARFEEAEEALSLPLRRLCFEGPPEELEQTAVTQPAVFVHSVAAAEVLALQGVEPACASGHSLGEYSALTAAGVFDFATAVGLVRERGRLMQEAGEQHPGTMAAIIGLEDSQVARLCAEAAPDGDAVPANFNAPGQVVVSGTAGAVAAVCEAAGPAGASRVVPLEVSGAFHSRLMKSAADEMSARLREVEMRRPAVPVVANASAQATEDVGDLRRQLLQQILAPVRWTECVKEIAARGIAAAAEVGPGSVLRGLVRRIERKMTVFAAGTAAEIENLTGKFAEARRDG